MISTEPQAGPSSSSGTSKYQPIAPSDLPANALNPQDIKVRKTDDPYADQEARWNLIKRYIDDVLADKPKDPAVYMAAVHAVWEIETASRDMGAGAVMLKDGKQVHGLRVRVVKLLLSYRDQHRATSPTEDPSLWTDEVFIQRWTSAARIFAYHDRHFVKRCVDERATGGGVAGEGFPDDGRTGMFELGRRVWYDERVMDSEVDGEDRRGPVAMAESYPSRQRT